MRDMVFLLINTVGQKFCEHNLTWVKTVLLTNEWETSVTTWRHGLSRQKKSYV